MASWLDDLSGALGAIAAPVASYFMNQQTMKNQIKVAKASAGVGPTLTYPGLGYSAAPLVPYGAVMNAQGGFGNPGSYGSVIPASFGAPGALPAPTTMGQIGDFLGFSNDVTGAQGCSLYHRPMGPSSMRARPQSLVMQMNPDTGRMGFWRYVGQPILYSGDVSHCRRVAKILGRGARRIYRKR